MAITTPLAYNPTASPISGTTQVGTLAVGEIDQDYSNNLGGVPWWMGPDELTGYVIGVPVSGNTQPTFLINPSGNLTLSTTYIGNDITLSNGNQTASQLFGYQQTVLGNTYLGPTKTMFSVLVNLSAPATLPGSHVIGIGRTTMNYKSIPPYGAYPGNDSDSMGYCSDGTILYQGTVYASGYLTWTNGDTIDIVINNEINGMWIRVSGGLWNNSSINDSNPATNIGAIEIINGPFYPALCPGYEGSMTIQNSATYGLPSGYTFLGSNITSSVGFYQTPTISDSEFISLAQYVSIEYGNPQTFSGATDASIWLTNNGYWNSYIAPVLYLDAGNPASYPGTGTVWTDLIGGRQFNLINGPGYDPSNGGKIYFNAPSGQYAECSTSLPTLSIWSVGVWHYYTGANVGSSPCIVTEVYPGTNATINYALGTLNDDTPLLKAGFFTAGWNETTTPYTLTANTWNYIVGTYDGNAVKLYVNNTLIATTNTTTSAISSNGGIRLMRRWDANQFWDGYLSTVGIYDKALTQGQISGIYNTTKSRYGL